MSRKALCMYVYACGLRASSGSNQFSALPIGQPTNYLVAVALSSLPPQAVQCPRELLCRKRAAVVHLLLNIAIAPYPGLRDRNLDLT